MSNEHLSRFQGYTRETIPTVQRILNLLEKPFDRRMKVDFQDVDYILYIHSELDDILQSLEDRFYRLSE